MVFKMGPAFNRMWSASLISNLADGVLFAAVPILAISLTDNTVLISAIGAMVMVPWLLFAIPIGAMVDQLDRRYILAGANALRGLIVGVLAYMIAVDLVTIYLLIAVAFIIGVCEVAADTTSQSLIPQILDEESYEKGNSRLQMSETVVQGFIGAPLSGFLYAFAIYLPFFFNSVGFVFTAVLALSIPIKYLQDVRQEEAAARNKRNFVSDIKFGINFLYNHQVLRRIVITTSLIGVCYAIGTSTIVLFMINELSLPKPLFGVVLTIEGIGAILGALVAPRASKRFGRSATMTFGIFFSSLLLLLQGFSPNIYVFVALATLGSFTIAQWNILIMATYQTIIPNEIFGRVHGTRRTLVWGLMPIGSLLGGVLAHFGLRIPLYVGGSIATVIAFFSINFLRQIGANQETAK